MHHALIINVKRSLAEKELLSKRGKASRFVEQRLKDIADRQNRSNLCFAIWFSESVSVEVHEGLSYEEAKAVVDEKKSSEESVKMFGKSRTGRVLKQTPKRNRHRQPIYRKPKLLAKKNADPE